MHEEVHDILRDAGLLNDGVCGIHLHETGIVATHNAGNFLVGQHLGSGEFQQGGLHHEYLVVHEAVGLEHVYALLYLLDEHLRHLLLAIACDGVLVHAGGAGGTHVERLDVYLTACEHCGYLVQYAGIVLGEYDKRVEGKAMVAAEQCALVPGHGRTYHGIAAEGLHLLALCIVLLEGGLAQACQVLFIGIAVYGRGSRHGIVKALQFGHALFIECIALAACIAIAALGGTVFLFHNRTPPLTLPQGEGVYSTGE